MVAADPSAAWEKLESAVLKHIKAGEYDRAYSAYVKWCEQAEESPDDLPRAFRDQAARLLQKLPPGVAEEAVMALMLGTWDAEFVVSLTESRAAAYERDLLQYREAAYASGIRIEVSPSSECASAKLHAGCYRLEDAPDYPFGKCENDPEVGCLCFWTMVFDDERVRSWKVPLRRHPKAGGHIERPPPPLTMDNLRAVGQMLGVEEAGIVRAARNAGLATNETTETMAVAANSDSRLLGAMAFLRRIYRRFLR